MRSPLCFVSAVLLLAGAGCVSDPLSSTLPRRQDVLLTMERVADWQLAHPEESGRHPAHGWVQAAGYTGIMALADVSKSPKYFAAMREMGEKNGWKPGPRTYHADDHCVIQTYAELYQHDHRPEEIAPAVERFDYILTHQPTCTLEFIGESRDRRWSWCDSLFMAPPAWLRLWKATGKQAYLDFAVTHWWETSDYLYDQDEHLYFRDSTYFKKREANGQKVFWSRGNGWVVGGLVRVMQLLPAGHPARARFERQFKEMAAKLITLQQADGFWRSSLLDPVSYSAQEASGTAFYCYGLAWGVNEGLLDRATYLPHVMQAWNALLSCVGEGGRLKHVQPIGADPKKFDPNSTEPYGVGGFLLAGSEVYRLARR